MLLCETQFPCALETQLHVPISAAHYSLMLYPAAPCILRDLSLSNLTVPRAITCHHAITGVNGTSTPI